VIECDATESVLIANVAEPALMVPLPIVVPASLKVTVPVAFEGDTAAVNVTLAPKVDGFKEDVSVVVVGTGLTTWLSAEDALGALLVSPL
jgi:hypothetical protein